MGSVRPWCATCTSYFIPLPPRPPQVLRVTRKICSTVASFSLTLLAPDLSSIVLQMFGILWIDRQVPCPPPPREKDEPLLSYFTMIFFLSVIVWPVFFIDVEDIGDVKSLWDERSVHRLRFMTQTCFKKRQRTMLNRQMVKRMGMCIKEYRRKGKVESNKNEDYSFD